MQAYRLVGVSIVVQGVAWMLTFLRPTVLDATAAAPAFRTGGRPQALKPSQVERARKWIENRTMSQQQAACALNVACSTLARALR